MVFLYFMVFGSGIGGEGFSFFWGIGYRVFDYVLVSIWIVKFGYFFFYLFYQERVKGDKGYMGGLVL